MLRRLNIQVLNDPRNIWPVSASLLLHAIVLSLVIMPRAPKVPEFITIDLSSLPHFAAPASGPNPDASARKAVAPEKVVPQAQPAAKVPEMAEPVKHVKAAAPVSQAAPSTARPASGSQSAAGAQRGGSASPHAGQGVSNGPVDGSFGTANGPAFSTRVAPVYPRIARKLGKEGVVKLRLAIDEKGILTSVTVLEKAGHGFDEAAINAVKASRFKPARHRGMPVACRAMWSVVFRLEN